MADILTRPTVHHYEAPGVSGAPRLAGLPGADRCDGPDERVVEAFYYDTEDLRLVRAGICLARELEHSDAEWVLQLPEDDRGNAPEGDRIPLRVPHQEGDDTHAVPPAVLALVRAHTRGRSVGPVAHTQTTRSTWRLLDWEGGSLGEIRGDAVSGQTLGSSSTVDSWYLVTVTLSAPGERLRAAIEERLDDIGAQPAQPRSVLQRLLAPEPAPAPPAPRARRRVTLRKKSPAGDVVLAAVTAHVIALQEWDLKVRRDEPDAVHQMRVATRTLRSALRTFGRVIDREVTGEIATELRWLGGVLAGARDQEVVQERVEACLAGTPGEDVLGPVAAKLSQQFARERTEAHASVLAELDTDRYYALLNALDALVASPPLTPMDRKRARTALPPLVRRATKKLDKAVVRVDELPDGPERTEALHSVRKAAKRARYAAELVAPVMGKDATRSAKRFKAVQSLLGDHQDAVQTRRFLRAHGGRGHLAGQNGFTVGIWYQQQAEAADDVDAAFDDTWRRAARRKHRRWMH
jgi:CHAD domain-containing protein